MDSDAALLDQVLRRLEPLPVIGRHMFGGLGLYLEGVYFGVITDGVLYFRTDEESRDVYLARSMPALQPKHRPRGPRTVDRNFRVPDDVLEDSGMLRDWAIRAAASRR